MHKYRIGHCLAATLVLVLASCSSETTTNTTDPVTTVPPTSDADWTIQLNNTEVTLVEGEGNATVDVTIVRGDSQALPITLTAAGATTSQDLNLTTQFSDASLSSTQTDSTLAIQLAIGAAPLMPETRTLQITGDDSVSAPVTVNLLLEIQPTDKADVYLIVGQSNAVGFSEDDSREVLPGELDAPNERVLQLNVTGNDSENFATEEDFTTEISVYNVGEPLTPAVDPLHNGFNSNTQSKEGERIAFGLEFAKQALADTTADVYLVPAAWSDTGFCSRDTNRFDGLGWNATEKTNEALAGTLLHDRAITRANVAIAQTGGILRGILWHQGEADSDSMACAEVYAENLTELAESLRTNIDADARGAVARGSESDVPFIVGTMSQGEDTRGAQLPFGDAKVIVDNAHRNVTNLIPLSGVVLTEDLIPPAYPCGEGTCVHFGAAAQREMGVRYYTELKALLP